MLPLTPPIPSLFLHTHFSLWMLFDQPLSNILNEVIKANRQLVTLQLPRFSNIIFSDISFYSNVLPTHVLLESPYINITFYAPLHKASSSSAPTSFKATLGPTVNESVQDLNKKIPQSRVSNVGGPQ